MAFQPLSCQTKYLKKKIKISSEAIRRYLVIRNISMKNPKF